MTYYEKARKLAIDTLGPLGYDNNSPEVRSLTVKLSVLQCETSVVARLETIRAYTTEEPQKRRVNLFPRYPGELEAWYNAGSKHGEPGDCPTVGIRLLLRSK